MFMPMVMMMTTMMMTTMMMTTMLMRLLPLTMMITTILMRLLPLTVKILSIKMSMKRGLNEETLRGTLMTMRHWSIVNLMQTMLLMLKTL